MVRAFDGLAEVGHPVDVILRHRDARNHEWLRLSRSGLARPSWIDIVLAGTPELAAHAAGELCEQGPILVNDHKIVLDRIKRMLAARARQAGTSAGLTNNSTRSSQAHDHDTLGRLHVEPAYVHRPS
jgi:hypothetical protein